MVVYIILVLIIIFYIGHCALGENIVNPQYMMGESTGFYILLYVCGSFVILLVIVLCFINQFESTIVRVKYWLFSNRNQDLRRNYGNEQVANAHSADGSPNYYIDTISGAQFHNLGSDSGHGDQTDGSGGFHHNNGGGHVEDGGDEFVYTDPSKLYLQSSAEPQQPPPYSTLFPSPIFSTVPSPNTPAV